MGSGACSSTRRASDIERFHEAVLPRLVGGTIIPLDAGVLAIRKDGVTGQFGSVLANHHSRQLAPLGDGGELANDTLTRQQGINDAALGLGLIQSQNAGAVARATPDRKLASSLS